MFTFSSHYNIFQVPPNAVLPPLPTVHDASHNKPQDVKEEEEVYWSNLCLQLSPTCLIYPSCELSAFSDAHGPLMGTKKLSNKSKLPSTSNLALGVLLESSSSPSINRSDGHQNYMFPELSGERQKQNEARVKGMAGEHNRLPS